jgi:hypothetical protein
MKDKTFKVKLKEAWDDASVRNGLALLVSVVIATALYLIFR